MDAVCTLYLIFVFTKMTPSIGLILTEPAGPDAELLSQVISPHQRGYSDLETARMLCANRP